MAGDTRGPPLGLGIVGLGGAAVNMLPAFRRSPFFTIRAVADVDPVVLARFAHDHEGVRTYTSADQLCADPEVTLVYIGTPTRLHSEQARIALEHGKHVLIEKPMAVTLDEAEAMVLTAERHGVLLGVNVKHSFESRIQAIRNIARAGELGRLRMIQSWRYVNWLYLPRTAEELTPGWGNGLLWRQGPHHFDLIRTIGGGMMRSVRGMSGTWDSARRVPGAYTVYFEFDGDVCGTAVNSAYDHFSSGALVYGFDGGQPLADPERYGRARRELRSHSEDAPAWEASAAAAERYGGGRRSVAATKPKSQSGGWILNGPLIVSFDKGDVRLSPNGLIVDGDEKQWEIALPAKPDGRDNRLASFYHAIADGTPLPADGRWGMATQEVLVAVERSAATRSEIALERQVPWVSSARV
ncbi:MAG: Gfo/Idh/MocA family protein [Gemmatimonas sp.]